MLRVSRTSSSRSSFHRLVERNKDVIDALPAWIAGVAISTPVIAILQGALFLAEYRFNHGDAPRPDMPSRGVVIVRSNEPSINNNSLLSPDERRIKLLQHHRSSSSVAAAAAVQQQHRPFEWRWSSSSSKNNSNSRSSAISAGSGKPPLRLLVIGDSLAAGVGMSQSSTPVLPESVAHALSKALNGRAVYWTCVGIPGMSSSEVVEQIYQLMPTTTPRTTTNDAVKETTTSPAAADGGGLIRVLPTSLVTRIDELREKAEASRVQAEREWQRAERQWRAVIRDVKVWWQHVGKPVDDFCLPPPAAVDPEESSTTNRVVERWWKHQQAKIRRDLENFKHIVVLRPRPTLPVDNGEDETSADDSAPQQAAAESPTETALLQSDLERKLYIMASRNALDPEWINQYDIAIVLTGLNDLKNSFLPFMQQSQKLENDRVGEKETAVSDGSFKGELVRIVKALAQTTMQRIRLPAELSSSAAQSAQSESSCREQESPLVVFPALPVAPLSMTQTAPLGWFLLPLIERMDRTKQRLAELYPELVLFVESPSIQVLGDVEAKRGPLWSEDWTKDKVLLKLTDIAQTAKEHIQSRMEQHYRQSWVLDAEEDQYDGLYEIHCDDVWYTPFEALTWWTCTRPATGASMVSADGVHPNDLGYQVFGRLIANAIVERWEKEGRDNMMRA